MNNALQRIGNKNRAATITDPAYLSAKARMEEKFKAVLRVLVLKPDPSLFRWTSVSNIPAGLLEDAIKNISTNAQQLENPPSSEDICTLTQACRSFQVACQTYSTVRNKFNDVCERGARERESMGVGASFSPRK